MNRELLRVEFSELPQGGMPDFMLNFSILEGEINGIITNTTQISRRLLSFFSAERRLKGHTVYQYEKRLWAPENWMKSHCFVCDAAAQLVDTLDVWENIYVNKRVFRSIRGKHLARMRRFLERTGIDVNLSSKRVRDLTELETYIFLILKAYMLEKKLVLINIANVHFSATELGKFFVVMRRMIPLGMTFIILDFGDVRIRSRCGHYICIRSGIVQFQGDDLPLKACLDSKTGVHMEVSDACTVNEPFFVFSYDRQQRLFPSGSIVTVVDERCTAARQFFARFSFTKPEMRIGRGLSLVEDFTVDKNLFATFQVWENLCFKRNMPYAGALRKRRMRQYLCGYCRQVFQRDVGDLRISQLSLLEGQRLVCHKWLMQNPLVLVCYAPFENADVEMQHEILTMLETLAKRGSVIVLHAFADAQICALSSHIIRV